MFDDDVYGRISAGIPKKDSLVVEKLSNGDTASIGRYAITKEGDLSDLKTGYWKQYTENGELKEKKIDITFYRKEYERAKERLSTKQAEWMKKKRQSTVEPVFGTLMNYMGLSKINTRGILSADKKMLMAAAAYNLKKWLNFCQNRRKTAALVAPNPTVAALFWLMLMRFWLGSKNQRRLVLA
jgi:hypothetical protein